LTDASNDDEAESTTSQINTPAPTLRWASTGGGWRSQFACVGFANLFQKLNIISKFSAISTTSGASWFSTQLFYSQQFYDRVVHANDSSALYDFVVEWMDAYKQMLEDTIETSTTMTEELGLGKEICNFTDLGDDDGVDVENLSDLCHTIVYFGGDWAESKLFLFLEMCISYACAYLVSLSNYLFCLLLLLLVMNKMLLYTSKSYGDMNFTKKTAGYDNKIDDLKGTHLFIQSALVPNSRVRNNETSSSETAVYIGPSNDDTIYTVPLSAVYIVDDFGTTSYRYSTINVAQRSLDVSRAPTPSQFSFGDWKDFYLYPGENGTTNIEEFASKSNSLAQPFGRDSCGGGQCTGDSTVVQVASISSAVMGSRSPIIPSVYSQKYSKERYDLEQNGTMLELALYDKAIARMYNQPMLDNFAVCNQWPDSCGERDGYFIDGGFTDGPSLVINVAQYQAWYNDGDMNETLKVILTNTNEAWGTDYQYTQILQYFDSPINKDVEPGGFNWPPGWSLPCQSQQIFKEFMDESTLDSLIEPIPGSNMTTAILKGTTIDSPIFNIKSGLAVEILLINLNDPITTYVITPDLIDMYTMPLANMTVSIAENEELASRIKLFVEPALIDDDGNDDIDETNPPSSGQQSTPHQLLTVALLTFGVMNLLKWG